MIPRPSPSGAHIRPVRGAVQGSNRGAASTNILIFPHVRMPAILRPTGHEPWLNPNNLEVERLQSVLRPYPSEQVGTYPVSTRVNNPANDSLTLLEPVQSGPG